MIFKRGAMFGLDARIALAIFGALSVISGAALYSVIGHLKVEQRAQMLVELSKAVEQYALDTGSLIPKHPDNGYLDVRELKSSTAAGWKGPYIDHDVINYAAHCSNCVFDMEKFSTGSVFTSSNIELLQKTGSVFVNCTSGNDCMLYVSLLSQNNDMSDSLEEYFDGTIDDKNGKLIVFRSIYNGKEHNNVFLNTGLSVGHF